MGNKNKRTATISPVKMIEETFGLSFDKNGNTHFNPTVVQNADINAIKTFFDEYDLTQCTSRWRWDGPGAKLPKGLTSDQINRMIYYRPNLMSFRLLDEPYILPYMSAGKLDWYGNPKEVRPYTFSGASTPESDQEIPLLNKKAFKAIIDGEKDIYTTEDLKDKALIFRPAQPFYNNDQVMSRWALNQVMIKNMVEVFARIKINIVVSNKKLVFQVKDGNEVRKNYEQIADALSTNLPFVVVPFNLEVSSFQSSNDLNAEELFRVIKEYDNLRCLASGIETESYGSMKAERKIVAEMQGVNGQYKQFIDAEKIRYQNFADAFNKQNPEYKLVPVKIGEIEEEEVEEGEGAGQVFSDGKENIESEGEYNGE